MARITTSSISDHDSPVPLSKFHAITKKLPRLSLPQALSLTIRKRRCFVPLVVRYREGQKKSMVRHILATSLTTEYNLFFAFAR